MKSKQFDQIVESQTLAALRELLENEQRTQEKTAQDIESLKTESDEEESKKIKKDEKTKPVKADQVAKELVDVTLEKVVDKLNMMRSGKSANDKETKKNLEQYFKSLNMGERQSLYVFLDALNQIMTGGVEGKTAPEPEEQGIDTDPVKQKDDVTKAQKEKQDSIIVVGESQDTSDIKALIKELAR